MAKKPARVVPSAQQFKARNTMLERREQAGLQGRVIADLSTDELLELSATWLSKGMEGVQRDYGLTDGEAMALAKNPNWVALITVACNAQRAGSVHRMLQTVYRVMDSIDNKLASGAASLEDLRHLLDTVSAQIALLGGIEKNVNLNVNNQQQSALADAFNGNTAKSNPIETLNSDELGKLQALQRQLVALDRAGVKLDKPASA